MHIRDPRFGYTTLSGQGWAEKELWHWQPVLTLTDPSPPLRLETPAAPPGGTVIRWNALLNGLSASGSFFANPLG
jgi:hypothetical protein